jgi:hypothetical protein
LSFLGDICRWLQPGVRVGEQPSECNMNEIEARSIAGQWASAKRLKWTEPSEARCGRDGERLVWSVRSNATGRGHSIGVRIDDATKCVIDHDVLPR